MGFFMERNEPFQTFASDIEARGYGLYMVWNVSTDGGPRNVALYEVRGPVGPTEALLTAPIVNRIVVQDSRKNSFRLLVETGALTLDGAIDEILIGEKERAK